jgi:hypothetical protein
VAHGPFIGEIPPGDVKRTGYGKIDRHEFRKNFQKGFTAAKSVKIA